MHSKVLKIEPENATAAKENLRLRAAKKEYRASSRAMAERMTKKLFPSTSASNSTLSSDINTQDDTTGANSMTRQTEMEAETNPTEERRLMEACSEDKKYWRQESPAGINTQVSSESSQQGQALDTSSAAPTATIPSPPPESSYSLFILLGTSLLVLLVSLAVAYFAAAPHTSQDK